MPSQYIEINRNKYFVRTWGNKKNPKIMLLHGFPENSGAWSALASYLKISYYLIAPDQRGFGLSWSPIEAKYYRMSSIIKDLKSLINHFDDEMIILGHDWGAAAAYALAFRYPKNITKLIIMNGVHPILFQKALLSGGAQTKASQYINYLRKENAENALKANNFEKLLKLFSAQMDVSWFKGQTKNRYLEEWSRPGKLKTMLNWYKESPLIIPTSDTPQSNIDLSDLSLTIKCPHLLIWGENDTALLPESYNGLRKYCENLKTITINNADHWLHHQKPKAIAKLIDNWLINSPTGKE